MIRIKSVLLRILSCFVADSVECRDVRNQSQSSTTIVCLVVMIVVGMSECKWFVLIVLIGGVLGSPRSRNYQKERKCRDNND